MEQIISYASLERIEEGFAVCEVEKIFFFSSIVGDFTKECFTANIPLNFFNDKGITVQTGNVYSVVVENEEVKEVLRYEEAETRRRKEWISSIQRNTLCS